MKGVGEWLASRKVGASSSALAAATLGVLPDHAPSYPHDADDFGRCKFLWDRTPEAREGLKRLAAISGPWHRLSERWDELLALHENDLKACSSLIRKLTEMPTPYCQISKGEDGRWDARPL